MKTQVTRTNIHSEITQCIRSTSRRGETIETHDTIVDSQPPVMTERFRPNPRTNTFLPDRQAMDAFVLSVQALTKLGWPFDKAMQAVESTMRILHSQDGVR